MKPNIVQIFSHFLRYNDIFHSRETNYRGTKNYVSFNIVCSDFVDVVIQLYLCMISINVGIGFSFPKNDAIGIIVKHIWYRTANNLRAAIILPWQFYT